VTEKWNMKKIKQRWFVGFAEGWSPENTRRFVENVKEKSSKVCQRLGLKPRKPLSRPLKQSTIINCLFFPAGKAVPQTTLHSVWLHSFAHRFFCWDLQFL
jgi:hypothetical protein